VFLELLFFFFHAGNPISKDQTGNPEETEFRKEATHQLLVSDSKIYPATEKGPNHITFNHQTSLN
jgi:hypothetical protein